jgi:glycine/sarcosine N-methyltransferase
MDPPETLLRFYSGFAGKYDLFMPWDKRIRRERRFFKYVLDSNGVNTVMDGFCGTGFHVAMLSEMGYDVEGIDISPDMIAKAKENLKTQGWDNRVSVCDVKSLDTEKRYDCVLSMGNSLPHEFGEDNVYRAIKSMYEALEPGGVCIIHMENFDRLYEDRERFIPSLHRRGEDGTETFIFAIDYHKNKVVFNILSIIEKDGLPKFAVDTVEYNPIKIDRLRSLIRKAGFGDMKWYEDFRMSPPGMPGTYDIIVVATK